MSAQIVKDFNTILETLIQQMTPSIGNSYHPLFKKLIKYNAIAPIRTFGEYAFPWKEHIENRDEDFFLNKSLVEDATDDNNALTQIFQLQDVWKNLDDESKENLWCMTEALLAMAEEYHKLKG